MAVTPLAGPKPWRWLTLCVLACLVAAGPAVRAARAAEAPPPAPAAAPPPAPAAALAEALAAARDGIRQLDLLRPVSDAGAERVAAILQKALGALDRAEAAAKTQLDDLTPEKKPLRGVVDQRLAAEVLRLRADACRIALARADLNHRAAAALPEGHAARAARIDDALAAYRSLRVAYHDIAPGLMGYIGEAAVQRLAGDAEAARAALQTVLQIPEDPKNPLVADLRRVALLEDLEALLLADPDKAVAAAAALRAGKEYKDRPEWQARLDYVVARAYVAQAAKLPAEGPDAARRKDLVRQALGLVRGEAVAGIAPAYDRLALLVKLETLSGERVLSRDELLGWADLLAAAGRDEAVAFYDRAKTVSDAPLGNRQLLAYIALAMRQGRFADVADSCDRLLKELPAADPQRPAVLQWRAASLLKVLQTPEAAAKPDAQASRTLAALAAVVESASPEAVRRDALRQWAALEGGRAGLGACRDRLQAHKDLVAGDPYLLYTLAAAGSQRLSDQWTEGVVGEAAARDGVRKIAADLEKVAAAASQAGDQGILARGALLRARLLARPPVRDAAQALAALKAQETALKADAAVAGAAAWLKVEVLLDLGLIEEAFKALAEVPEGYGEGSPLARLQLAEALAARYADIAPAGRAEVQRRVLGLCDAAMAQAAAGDLFVTVASRAARALLDVAAAADARRVLDQLLASEKVRGDDRLLEACSLLMAEAYRGGGKLNEAMGLLDQLASRFPDSFEVHLARGRCRMDLSQAGRAVESFRKARGLARAGREDWCRATLALAEGLAAGDYAADASDVLRVAEALYPDFGTPELRSQMKRMRRRLETPTPREAARAR
jgi:hypothetical protein